MNADQLKGIWMRFKGDLKQQWGKFTDDHLQQIEGSYEKVIGMLQERYGDNCVRLVRERYSEEKDELIRWAGRGSGGLSRKSRRKTCAHGKSSTRESIDH